jgi:phage gp29-like protein
LIRAAERQADAGNFRLAADLCEQMLGDDRIGLGLSKRIQGLLKFDVSFEQGKRGGSKPVKALDAGEDWYSILPEDEHAEIKRVGLLLGFCPVRLNWILDETSGRQLPCAVAWPVFGTQFDGYDWSVLVDNIGTRERIQPGDGKWALYTPFSRHRPWARGLWRGLSRWWLLKQYAISDFGEAGAEKPKKVVSETDGDHGEFKEKRRKELAEEINAMAEAGVIVLPKGFTMQMVEQSANSWQMYEAQIRLADEAIIVAIAWHNLGTLVEGGSFAAASTAVGVELGALSYDNQVDASWAHDEILVHWAEVNFGSREAAPWPARKVELPVDPKAEAETLAAAAPAIAQLVTLGADRKKLLERFRIDVEAEAPGGQLDAVQIDPALVGVGVFTINEIRRSYGLPDMPGGNVPPQPQAAPQGPPAGPAGLMAQGPSDPVADVEEDPATVQLSTTTLDQRRADWVASQIRTDAVADSGIKQAADAMAPVRDEVIAGLAKCQDYDAARSLLSKIVGSSNADKHAEIIYRAMVLAHLQGAAGVTA